jgi:phosphatidate cytidylyltransferase
MAERASAFTLRLVSAIILVPLALAAVWFGPPWISVLVAVAGAAMAWEWGRLTALGRAGPRQILVIAAVLAAVAAAALGWFVAAPVMAALGAIAAALCAPNDRIWTGAGTLWIGAGAAAFLWLAALGGHDLVLPLLFVVWATDICAYTAGKALGGPKLAPALSPNKTWAGFAGGIIGAAVIGVGVVVVLPVPLLYAGMGGIGLSLAAQAGDLVESVAKRHFGVKDASGLIPGHGGALDRLDGLIAASIALALALLAAGWPVWG